MRNTFIYFLICVTCLFTITSCAKREEPRKEAGLMSESHKTSGDRAESSPSSTSKITEEKVLFSFENRLEGWDIPEWALDKDDHVGRSVEVSSDVASEGKFSLKMDCDFPGGIWSAAVVEVEQFLDLSPYREIAVDVYIPKNAPLGLRGKIILTVEDSWKFTEMTRSILLVPGEWITINANIEQGSYDWKKIAPDEDFANDVRKVMVRVESNKSPVYKGPIYIDNIRIGK
ncbi:MAG: hypothetical protein JW994_06810 [Candidatus Omnitrophica bacterium]|nr:hypothetical protein [Candidatus Omnitrophota bacterium]